jgi:CheY-like chemotaxis protein
MVAAMKILIVEDNPKIRQMVRRLVADLADDICECEDGADALAQYRAFQPDWVLMDWQMPRVNGLIATQQIIGYDPTARIVIVTGFDDPGVQAATQAAGARGYVLKENLLELRHWLQTEMAQQTMNASNQPATEKGTIQ